MFLVISSILLDLLRLIVGIVHESLSGFSLLLVQIVPCIFDPVIFQFFPLDFLFIVVPMDREIIQVYYKVASVPGKETNVRKRSCKTVLRLVRGTAKFDFS